METMEILTIVVIAFIAGMVSAWEILDTITFRKELERQRDNWLSGHWTMKRKY